MMKACNAVARILAASVLMALAGAVAAQQAYPNKPIRFIVPYPTGGGGDAVARLVSQKLTESWSQQLIVDNRAGGNTIIGTEAAAKSRPDGYSILLMTMDQTIIANLFSTLYDAIKDFAPVATLSSSELIMVLHPSVPASNLREFIALAKSRPGQLNYASSGSATVTNLAGEFFNILAEVKMQHIPYKGSAPAISDLLGGQVQLYFSPPVAVVAHIKTGRLKAIAVTGGTRLQALPQVPTFTEAGLPGLDMKLWYGVLAPAGTPKPIIDKLSTEIARILAAPDIKEKLAGLGTDPFVSTPDQFAALIKADLAKFAKLIKTANIKLEQ